MRRIQTALIAAASMLVVHAAFAAEQTATFSVEKMTCALCPFTVRAAMEHVNGVQTVVVNYDTKSAVVTFDDEKTTVALIAQAATNIGYPASPSDEQHREPLDIN